MEKTFDEVLRIMDSSRYDNSVSDEMRAALQILYPKIRDLANKMEEEGLLY